MSAESQPADKLIGQILADRYQILHRLGEGAMGAVYKARHVKVGRSFAVKVLHARLLQDPKVALRFEREAELAGRLRHPNVVGVVDVGELDDMRYMVMEFAEGPDLAQLLVEAPMPAERIIPLVRQMLEGLYHAHERGLIHRDFKPENVIVERDTHGAEVPRIVDFGIAILRDGGDTFDAQGRLTTNGLVLGTPHYMAPEQAVADPIDHRIDLFALGIVIYEMLCGRLPFDGSGAEVARANLLLDPPRIVQRVPYLEVDPLLEAFARCLMAKKRDARPATANAARELLDLIDHDRPAASAALGVPMSERAPAATQSVAPQDRLGSETGPPAGPTARMKPTPPASQPAQAALWPPGVAQSTSLEGPAATPVVFSASRAAGAQASHRTSVRTPLSWEAAPVAKRRKSWLIAGVALGAVGIAVGWIIATTGTDPDASTPGARVVMTAIGPDPATRSAPAPTTAVPNPTGPTAADPTASGSSERIDTGAMGSSAGEPETADTKLSAKRSPALDASARDSKAAELHPPDVKAANARAVDVTSMDAKAASIRAAGTRAASTRAASSNTADAKAANARATDIKAPDARAANSSAVNSSTADADAANARAADVKSADGRAADTKGTGTRAADARAAETPAADTKAAPKAADAKLGGTGAGSTGTGPTAAKRSDPRPTGGKAPPLTGVTAKGISSLYYAVPRQLKQLPEGEAEDLWNRWRRFSVQTLMLAPQATRDEAATELTQILNEATVRKGP